VLLITKLSDAIKITVFDLLNNCLTIVDERKILCFHCKVIFKSPLLTGIYYSAWKKNIFCKFLVILSFLTILKIVNTILKH
jgi:hypothetical protein